MIGHVLWIVLLAGIATPAGSVLGDTGRLDLPLEEFPNSFTEAPYVNPTIIQDMTTWLSDSGDQVVAINLLDSQRSNRYSETIKSKEASETHPYVYVEGDRTEFGYWYVGRTESGVHVITTSDWGGGSAVFRSLMFLVIERSRSVSFHPDENRIDLSRDTLLIRKLGETALGDRYAGSLRVEGNRLIIGEDEGWFSESSGTGGDPRTKSVVHHLDFEY